MGIRTTTATAATTTNDPAWRQVLVAAVLAVPAIVLAGFGYMHMRDGTAQDAAIPVPVYMVAQLPMPKAAYLSAESALARANRRNGEAMLQRGEAALRAGEPDQAVTAIATEGLKHQPASARGWTLLAEALMKKDKKRSAEVLSQALLLGPRDFWLIGPRASDAASLWNQLDPGAQAKALEQARMLWHEPALRPQLFVVLKSPAGVELQGRALADEPDQMRAMNKWIRQEMRRLANVQ